MGRILTARERVHLVRVEAHEPVPEIDLEAEGVYEVRWWTLAELERAEETLVPARLAAFLRRLLRDGPPAEPIDVGV